MLKLSVNAQPKVANSLCFSCQYSFQCCFLSWANLVSYIFIVAAMGAGVSNIYWIFNASKAASIT